jgi:hypothetical protein
MGFWRRPTVKNVIGKNMQVTSVSCFMLSF